MIAWHSASNRSTSSVMLSSTMKMHARAARRASRMSAMHAVDREAVEVAAAHLDDRAEAAVERAAARGLDDVDRAAHQRVAGQHARSAVRRPNRIRPSSRVTSRCGFAAKRCRRRETTDRRPPSSGRPVLERAEQPPGTSRRPRRGRSRPRREPDRSTHPAPGSDRSRRRRCATSGASERMSAMIRRAVAR